MLKIKNANDMKGVKFLNGRFTLREIEENRPAQEALFKTWEEIKEKK